MSQHNFAAMRSAMIASQLRTSGVNTPAVLAAFESVARERFVPDARATLAYADSSIPLGGDRALNPTLTSARLLNEAHILPTDHVLLIGAATGYLAAVIAQIAASIVAVDDRQDLLDIAARECAEAHAITWVNAPLSAGASAQGPYDAILIDGAVEHIPDTIVDQLKPGGRLSTGLMERGVTRLATGRRSAGGFGITAFAESTCVALPGFSLPKVFTFA